MAYHNVPVKPRTWARLQAYRMMSPTYDALLNRLMDSLPLEMLTKETLAEAEHRLATFDGVPWREATQETKKKRAPRRV